MTDLERRWLLETEEVYRGNVVELLTEGSEYFEQWFFGLDRIATTSEHPRRLLHLAWRLVDVARFGRLSASTRVIKHLRDAVERRVDVRLSVSGHGWGTIALSLPVMSKLLRLRRLQAFVDLTTPTTIQSNHQKLSIFEAGDQVWALIGSIDLAPTRFERAHGRVDPRRYHSHRGPSHDVGLKIVGPGATELQRRFAARWSGLCGVPGRRRILRLSGCTLLEERPIPTVAADPHGSPIQIVETTPSHADVPLPATDAIARLYRKALTQAQTYVYIEDQYFMPDFRDTRMGHRLVPEDENLLPLLLGALDREVYVIVLLPTLKAGRSGFVDGIIRQRRDAALRELRSHPNADRRLLVLHYGPEAQPVYVHSKLLLCDDAFMLLGSANVNRRGMLSDYEIGVGVADPLLVGAVRQRLWLEHAGLDPADLASPKSVEVSQMVELLRASRRLTAYHVADQGGSQGRLASWLVDRFVDPVG